MAGETAKTDHERITRVLDYIKEHLDRPLPCEALSQVAHLSKYHFQRQFIAYTGISAFKYIRLLRLKRAAYRLAYRPRQLIIDIAAEAGYETPEAFSREFKKVYLQTPAAFRKSPVWGELEERLEIRTTKRIRERNKGKDVNIVYFEGARVATLSHEGHPGQILDTVRIFIQWRKENNLPPRISETYNIFYPPASELEEYRIDICASIRAPVGENPYGVVTKQIASGRCAVLRHVGTDNDIDESVDYLYRDWLPQSGEPLRDAPCFFHRVTLFPDVHEHEMITDIYLPLE